MQQNGEVVNNQTVRLVAEAIGQVVGIKKTLGSPAGGKVKIEVSDDGFTGFFLHEGLKFSLSNN